MEMSQDKKQKPGEEGEEILYATPSLSWKKFDRTL